MIVFNEWHLTVRVTDDLINSDLDEVAFIVERELFRCVATIRDQLQARSLQAKLDVTQ